MKISYKGPRITWDFEGSIEELKQFKETYEDIERQSWKEKNGKKQL